MKPVLFEFLGFEVHSYGLLLAVSFAIGIIGTSIATKEHGIRFSTIIDLGLWILLGSVLGARIVFILTKWAHFIKYPDEIIKLSSDGLSFHGGLLSGFLAGFWFCCSHKINPWKLADRVSPFIAIGYSITRIGCFLDGCCYGKASALPWALRCSGNDSLLRHPTQIYSLTGSLIIFLIIWLLRNHKQFPGFLFLLYIGLYSIVRFIVEFYREGPIVLPCLNLAQLSCIVSAFLAFGLIRLRQLKLRKGVYDAVSEVNR